ncbi:glycosyl transferase family 8 protein [Besnoitia besnoiti]|uniref:Glycosyl transferase family 8 protein n=1 Tax=Besnoitia besnoiti TaxID=94643 RepID=A0A2A9M6D6_BESBE|nr:glycosyl transferase family 8 protein [Besnoitia besnoiti]PFH34038.1 glycosyl transferase family 8 protein [Besnoitia besnoiti]
MLPRYAYATLLTDNSFYYGVEALLKSLEATKSQYPLLLLYTASVSKSTIKSLIHKRQAVYNGEQAPGKLAPQDEKEYDSCPAVTGSEDISCDVRASEPESKEGHQGALGKGDTPFDRDSKPKGNLDEHLSENEASESVLSKDGKICVIPRLVDPIPYPDNKKSKCHVPGWETCFTKLRLWEQSDFDVVVYVDADCIVLDCIDDLFFRQPLPAFAPDIFPPDKFNAGVVVLKPDAGEFEKMVSALAHLPSHDGSDTGFLNAYFASWYTSPAGARLPFRYNAQRTLYHMTYASQRGYWDAVRPIKILHFCSSPKPWEPAGKQTELEKLWWHVFLTGTIPVESDIV